MPIEEIDVTMAGDSTLGAAAAMLYTASSPMVGDSTTGPVSNMTYRGISTMLGDAVVVFTASEFDTDSLALLGDSSFSATAGVSKPLSMFLLGNSALMFDPAGITIVNFSRGPQIPATAKPVTIPTIRMVPQSPPAPTYSIGSPARRRNPRREGL